MTTRWIASAIIVTAAGLLAFGITRTIVCKPARYELESLWDISFLRRELKLTDSQVGQLETLHAGLAVTLGDCCARHCSARAQLAKALAAESTNAVVMTDAVLQEMCRAYEESERATLEHIRQVHALLDAKQRERFHQMLTECLCRECRSCDARGRHDLTGLPRCGSRNGTKAGGR